MSERPAVDVVDSTWVAVAPELLAVPVADPVRWTSWWPDLTLEVSELRGAKGVRWRVQRDTAGLLCGSMEIWLQELAVGSSGEVGTLAHFFLRLDRRPSAHPAVRVTPRHAARLVAAHRANAKRLFWSLSDELDPGRLARVRARRPGSGASGAAAPAG